MIQDNAKKILKYLLEQVISIGDLDNEFLIRYDVLAKELEFESENLCRVCCQYLNRHNYINIIENIDNCREIRLTVKGIDFLEAINKV